MTGTRPIRTLCVMALGLALAGCQQGGGEDSFGEPPGSGEISPVAGALGGAGAGALAGRLLAGGHDNTAAILGGALIGGIGGLLGTSAYNEHKTQESQSEQLSYTQNQLAQQEAVNRELQSQNLYDQWGEAQGHGGPVNAPADVTTAQRMLTVLGLYTGPIDGQNGPATSVAVAEFQKSRGLPTTGNVTPSLLQMMKVAI